MGGSRGGGAAGPLRPTASLPRAPPLGAAAPRGASASAAASSSASSAKAARTCERGRAGGAGRRGRRRGGGAAVKSAARPCRRGGPGPGLGRRGGRWPAGRVAGLVFPGRRRGVPAAAPPLGLRAGSGYPRCGCERASKRVLLPPPSFRSSALSWGGGTRAVPREPVGTKRLGEEEERPGLAETGRAPRWRFSQSVAEADGCVALPPQGPPLSEKPRSTATRPPPSRPLPRSRKAWWPPALAAQQRGGG